MQVGLPALVRGVRGSGAFGPPWGTILAIGLGEIAPSISGGLEAHRCSASPLDKSSILPPRKRACHTPSAKVGYHCLVAVHLRAVLRAAGVSSCAHRPELLKAARSFNLSPFMDGDDCASGSSNTAVAEHSECNSTQGQSASCGRCQGDHRVLHICGKRRNRPIIEPSKRSRRSAARPHT